ncbi:MAG: phospho-N-acetylmuramoyl-pentapeptide-transferase, partial [Chloroflexi bacterium]|nr:phospho-N-acetylmuramoyl-pentapeptide-transferase [Chloroflexota bacterium]
MGTTLFMGAITFLITVMLGHPWMRLLKHYRIGKQIRSEEPSSNQAKMGTLTMGGVLIVVPTVVLILVMYAYTRLAARIPVDFGGVVLVGRSLAVPIGVLVGFAVLGAIDDYMGVRGVRRGEGMRGRSKAVIQLVIS